MKVLMTGASNIGKAGVATIAFRLGQAMDEKQVQVSYLAQRGVPDKKYIKLAEDKGGYVYSMNGNNGSKIRRMLNIIQWIGGVFKENSFDIIHINTDTAYLAAVYLWQAKKAGIPKIAVHCHSTMVDEKNVFIRKIKIVLHKLCCRYVRRNADLKFACSTNAARWLFGNNKVTVIPNGFDIDRFAFNQRKRDEYRRLLNIEDKFVICSVGRLAYQKNPFSTIDIYREILKKEKDSVLLFIGEGELRGEIERYVAEKHLDSQQVILLGNRNDIPELLSASDVFLLPSRFEGLGIVYMEAQASGMPVFASDQVPEEAFITDLIHRIPLRDSPKQWADEIMKYKDIPRKDEREKIKKKGFDVRVASRILQKVYLNI